MTTANPMNGPFPSSRDLTDYRDWPGYAIPPRPVTSGDASSRALARLDRALARKAA